MSTEVRCIISVWVTNQAWGQDGWILAKFFFLRVYGPGRSRGCKRGQYSAILTEQARSIKDLLNGFRENLSSGRERLVPSGQDGAILSARVVNHSAGFCSSCPLTELGASYIKDEKYFLNSPCYDHPVSIVSIANGLSVRTTLYQL